MKKVFVFILLILSCSLITEQYLYYQTNKHINTEQSIPANLSHQNFGEHSDNHEFIVVNNRILNISNLLIEAKIIYPLNLHPQKSINCIWQPPEVML
jgi:hypothetical protein